ncbi:hypothetical protein GW746_01560 [Candidatus Saccharibacteria bacterium]|nr:hypothetical protein [Candidatus Saccharibacteria bacterium]NCS83084.1 hypothetical protein [Candidatus Saccharibacteria bacterium]
MLKKYQGKLYCFSPPVMLLTFLFEFGAAFYTIWRYKMTTTSRLAVSILLALGTFQLAEYMICGGLGLSNVEWAKLGYASITLLPALGIHIILSIANKKSRALLSFAYATCAAFLVFFVFVNQAVSAESCQPNYAVFSTDSISVWPYIIYYYGWMLVGTFLAFKWSQEIPKAKKALIGMSIGYLSFILPTTFFNIIDPSTVKGIPSIMCGFAVLLAIVIVTVVLPHSAKKR